MTDVDMIIDYFVDGLVIVACIAASVVLTYMLVGSVLREIGVYDPVVTTTNDDGDIVRNDAGYAMLFGKVLWIVGGTVFLLSTLGYVGSETLGVI